MPIAALETDPAASDVGTDASLSDPSALDLEPIETEDQIFERLTADSFLLNYIDEAAFRAAGHINRLPEEEDLSSYVFENEDGTRTAYLVEKKNDVTTTIWDKDIESLERPEIASLLNKLRCDENGVSVNEYIVPKSTGYGYADIYKDLYESLVDEYGSEYEVCFFAYDWRLSNQISANRLDDFINNKKFTDVVLICHSMGGLVASGYLAKGSSQRAKIDTVIMVGSPLLGTPVMPYVWGTEDLSPLNIGFSIPEIITWFLNVLNKYIHNYSSLYELFPSENYFSETYAGKSYLIIDSINIYNEVLTYSDTRMRLDEYLPYFNASLANEAETFHNTLYDEDSEHITNSVNTYYIAGYGLNTKNILKFNLMDWSSYMPTEQGDTMVPVWSATLNDRYAERTFYVDGTEIIKNNEPSKIDHTGLVQDDEMLSFIHDLIQNRTDVANYARISKELI